MEVPSELIHPGIIKALTPDEVSLTQAVISKKANDSGCQDESADEREAQDHQDGLPPLQDNR